MNPGWAKVPQAAEHLGLSPRTVRDLLKRGLPHSRLPSGTILVELKQADDWLRGFAVGRKDQAIVSEIIKGL